MSEIIRNVIPPQLASEIEWHLGRSLDYKNVYSAETTNPSFLQMIEDARGALAKRLRIDPSDVDKDLQIVERGGKSYKHQDRDLHLDGNERVTLALSSYKRLNAGTVCIEGVKAQFQYGRASEKILTNRR